eukprot:CAMPEP_0197852328 /NCGR_PEP_ID=MMETSP1438-20131217/20287_1 /TAXON_ID=1461541 /ORGANISM="Pterosperma sp., Strain CCMP1384" /LENGTH=243 /DNA_ID=CAMNT_0043466323 /DNA_START=327 /DNA_END=1058 /DNA_ORIENTATION=-
MSPGGSDSGHRRRFSVVIPGTDKNSMFLSQLEVGQDGLKLWNILGDDVLNEYKFDQIDSWWYADDQFVITVNTPEGEKEVKLKSKKSEEIINAMQECVDTILWRRQSLIDQKEQMITGATPTVGIGQRMNSLAPNELQRGWLGKKKRKFPYGWQKRFFILSRVGGQPAVLKYYHGEPKEDELPPLGQIDMSDVHLVSKGSKGTVIAFTAWQTNKSRQRPFELKAEDLTQKDAWIGILGTLKNE